MTDKHKDLSRAGQARRDAMLPLMQEAMRDAVRRKRQRQSVAGFALLAIGVLVGWGLLDMGANTTPTRETIVAESEPVDPTPKTQLDWQSFDPVRAYESLDLDAVVVSAAPTSDLPSNWKIDRTLVKDIPTVTDTELLALFANEGVQAAILCNASGCKLHHNLRNPTDQAPDENPVS